MNNRSLKRLQAVQSAVALATTFTRKQYLNAHMCAVYLLTWYVSAINNACGLRCLTGSDPQLAKQQLKLPLCAPHHTRMTISATTDYNLAEDAVHTASRAQDPLLWLLSDQRKRAAGSRGRLTGACPAAADGTPLPNALDWRVAPRNCSLRLAHAELKSATQRCRLACRLSKTTSCLHAPRIQRRWAPDLLQSRTPGTRHFTYFL